MPVYLVHGFRWPRDGFNGIRVHAIVHNLEDCSVEYVQNENSKREILGSFRKLYPDVMQHLDNPKTGQTLELLEQYDPEIEHGPNSVSQPYAFIGDKVVMIAGGSTQNDATNPTTGRRPPSPPATRKPKPAVLPMSKAPPITAPNMSGALSLNVEEVIADGPGVTPQAWEALAELRDHLAEGEKIGWWVVYNGDPERNYEPSDSETERDEQEEEDEDEDEVEGAIEPPRRALHQTSLSSHPMKSPATFDPVAKKSEPSTNRTPHREDTITVPKERVSESSKPKDANKKQGLRNKFFGKKS